MASSSDGEMDSEYGEDMEATLADAPLLRHARDVYLPSVFCIFHDEYKKLRSLNVDVLDETVDHRGLVFNYEVGKSYRFLKPKLAYYHSRQHEVTAVPLDGIVDCSCKKFEFAGILCCHALKVLRCLRIEMIPEKYILKRLTKNARFGTVEESSNPKETHKRWQSSPDFFHPRHDDMTDSELDEDMDVSHVDAPLLKHARDIYSSNIFYLFQDEYKKSRSLHVGVVHETSDGRGLVIKYKVGKLGPHSRHHTVTAVPFNGIVNCSCKRFELAGILCSHALLVLECLRKEMIPDQYILKKWTKTARVGVLEEIHKHEAREDSKLVVKTHYETLHTSLEILAGRASKSEVAYNLPTGYADKLSIIVEDILKIQMPSETHGLSYAACEGCKQDNAVNMNVLGSSSIMQAERLKKRKDCGGSQLKICPENGSKKKKGQLIQDPKPSVVPLNPCLPPSCNRPKGMNQANPMLWSNYEQYSQGVIFPVLPPIPQGAIFLPMQLAGPSFWQGQPQQPGQTMPSPVMPSPPLLQFRPGPPSMHATTTPDRMGCSPPPQQLARRLPTMPQVSMPPPPPPS